MTRPERLGVFYFQPLTQRISMRTRRTDLLRLSLAFIIFITIRAFVTQKYEH